MRASSHDLRHHVLRAGDHGHSREDIIERFQVSRATMTCSVKHRHETGAVLPRPIPGRPSTNGAALHVGVHALREAHPEARQHESCHWWEAEHGMQGSRATRCRAIHALGWVRTKEKRAHQHVSERKSPCPRPRGSRTHGSRGGGSVSPHARKTRRRRIQGSTHPRTARSAIGQDKGGRDPVSVRMFFPRCWHIDRTLWVVRRGRRSCVSRIVHRAGAGVRGVRPARREGTPDPLPVPPDGLVASHLRR
jgi:transposase